MTNITTVEDVSGASDDDLREVLLTVDGKGKATKEACLDELIARVKSEVYLDGMRDNESIQD